MGLMQLFGLVRLQDQRGDCSRARCRRRRGRPSHRGQSHRRSGGRGETGGLRCGDVLPEVFPFANHVIQLEIPCRDYLHQARASALSLAGSLPYRVALDRVSPEAACALLEDQEERSGSRLREEDCVVGRRWCDVRRLLSFATSRRLMSEEASSRRSTTWPTGIGTASPRIHSEPYLIGVIILSGTVRASYYECNTWASGACAIDFKSSDRASSNTYRRGHAREVNETSDETCGPLDLRRPPALPEEMAARAAPGVALGFGSSCRPLSSCSGRTPSGQSGAQPKCKNIACRCRNERTMFIARVALGDLRAWQMHAFSAYYP